MIIGWVLIYLTTHISNVQPTITGKAAIAMQLIVLCYVLLTINIVSLPKMPDVLILVTAALTIISGLHYIYRGLKLTHAQ